MKPLTKKRLQKRTLYELLGAVGIVMISTLPYFYDTITDSSGLREWVPVVGLEKAITDSQGYVMGFSSYRVFLYTLFLHLFAHIGFLGWMMDAKGKSYRIALVVPVILSGYTVTILLFNAKETQFNTTDVKFYITIALTLMVLVYYFIDHKNKKYSSSKLQDNNHHDA